MGGAWSPRLRFACFGFTQEPILVYSVLKISNSRGGSRIFFRRGCTCLLLYFNTNKPHSFLFFCRIPVVLENRRSSQRGAGVRTPCTLPLDPPLNSSRKIFRSCVWSPRESPASLVINIAGWEIIREKTKKTALQPWARQGPSIWNKPLRSVLWWW